MNDIIVNLLASVIAGTAVWVGQRMLRYQTTARRRSFFGVEKDAEVMLFIPRHASSNKAQSVHRGDVAALLEVATVVRDCGGQPTLVTVGDQPPASGKFTEYCMGGPGPNPRTAAYLRSTLRGVRVDAFEDAGEDLTFWVGDQDYRRRRGQEEYVLLARFPHPSSGRPVFLIMGQVARANLAAARYAVDNYRELRKSYGDRSAFCLVLRLREAEALGAGLTELVGDRTTEAFTARLPEPPVGAIRTH